MTVREEAYGLIDRLPEDSVRAVFQVMRRMPYSQKEKVERPVVATPKMKAFQELQAMWKEGVQYDFTADERASALEEKYGAFKWNGGA